MKTTQIIVLLLTSLSLNAQLFLGVHVGSENSTYKNSIEESSSISMYQGISHLRAGIDLEYFLSTGISIRFSPNYGARSMKFYSDHNYVLFDKAPVPAGFHSVYKITDIESPLSLSYYIGKKSLRPFLFIQGGPTFQVSAMVNVQGRFPAELNLKSEFDLTSELQQRWSWFYGYGAGLSYAIPQGNLQFTVSQSHSTKSVLNDEITGLSAHRKTLRATVGFGIKL